MNGHTPGPWEVSDYVSEWGNVIAMGPTPDGGRWFIRAPEDVKASEEFANAHLIAAAPALKDAIIDRAKRDACEYDDGEHEWRAYLTPAEADALAMVEREAKEAA